MYYDDINVTKEKLLRMGKNMTSSFTIYLPLEKEFSNGKFGKGETVTSPIKGV